MIEMETITIVPTKPWLTYDAPRWMRVVESFIRRRIFRQRSYLIDRWTIEEGEDCETQYGLDVVEEMTQALIQRVTRSRTADAEFTKALDKRTWDKYDD